MTRRGTRIELLLSGLVGEPVTAKQTKAGGRWRAVTGRTALARAQTREAHGDAGLP